MVDINNFIDKIKFFEARNSKDFVISMADAKNLHSDITKLLLVIHDMPPEHNTKSALSDDVSGGDW